MTAKSAQTQLLGVHDLQLTCYGTVMHVGNVAHQTAAAASIVDGLNQAAVGFVMLRVGRLLVMDF